MSSLHLKKTEYGMMMVSRAKAGRGSCICV